MNHNFPWEKLAKYFAGELTTEETKKMKIWIESDPQREDQVNFMYEIWAESGRLPFQVDIDKAWQNLEYNIEQLDKSKGTAPDSITENQYRHKIQYSRNSGQSAKKPGTIVRRIAIVAAAVLLILSTGLFTYLYHFELLQPERAEIIAKKILTTKNGERAVYSLSDGSKVILHAGSTIEIPLDFNINQRELFLEGEAYFEVVHNPEIPFIVHSGEAYTKVLGTKFLVRAWPDKIKNIEVIVEEGKVVLGDSQQFSSSTQKEVTITRNQKGLLGSGMNPSVSEVTNLHWHLGWIEGRLVFEDRKLSEILPLIERWYAVEINVEDNLILERKLTAEIDYTQPMMEVLKGIALSLDLKLYKEGQTITFQLAEDI